MNKLMSILQDLHPDINFAEETRLIDDGILDSFDIVTIVAEIDEEFAVAVPAEELIPENFNSAASIWAMLLRLAER